MAVMSHSPELFDAAIVLGSPPRLDGTPSGAQRRRVRAAVGLALRGQVGHLLMTGGPVAHPTPEAVTMAALAVEYGLAAERVAIEDRALNTIDNARRSAMIVAERGWRRLALVSDAYHLPRALYVFRRAGLVVSGIPASSPDTPRPDWWLAWAREAAALPWTVLRVEMLRLRS